MADGGYTGDNFAQSVRSVIGADVIIAKQSYLKDGYVTPQRWIVERTFSWLEKWQIFGSIANVSYTRVK